MEFIFGNRESFMILVCLVILPFALMYGHKQTKKRHAMLHEIGFEIASDSMIPVRTWEVGEDE